MGSARRDADSMGRTGVAAEIRGQQIHAMEENVWKSLVGYLIVALLASYLAFDEWSGMLIAWLVVTFIICGSRIALALRTALRPVRPRSARSERSLMIITAIVSITMASGPAWIALKSEGFVVAVMIMLVVSSTWGGALVQAPLFSSAASYTAATTPAWLVSLFVLGPTWSRVGLTALFLVTVVIAIDNVYRYARNFEQGLRQRMELREQGEHLEQQAEVIGLLLKEHEDQSSDWLWQTDVDGRIVHPSPRFADAFSRVAAEMEGRTLADLLRAPEVQGNAEAMARVREEMAAGSSFRDIVVPGAVGEERRWWSVSGRPVLGEDDRPAGYRGVMADVTVAKEAQAQVIHMAHHDVLTGLANRAYFHDRLRESLAVAGEAGASDEAGISLITMDLDGFKPVNDRYGHPVGDALLIAIADRLRAEVAASGIVARIGGDEFAIKSKINEPGAMDAFCRRLIRALARPYTVAGHDITIGASIGVAFAPSDGRTVEELFRNVDAALYRAKRDGRGTYRFFAPEMDHQLQERFLLLQDLREALRRDEFVLNYQPFVDASTGAITGCEALIRWIHPVRGIVPPMAFVPLAEESGLIVRIGAWVIETACAQAAQWPDDKRISVNISPVQFMDHELPDRIRAALVRSGLSAHRLELEVTEAVLIGNADAALDMLRRIRAIGVKIALDDFGTGYSSLSYLRRFPFDKVKIDRSFVTGIEEQHDSQVIVRGIRDIALGLGMTITAEGVETAGQAQMLVNSGCHELQGFLFSKPRPRTEMTQLFDGAGCMRWESERDTRQRSAHANRRLRLVRAE